MTNLFDKQMNDDLPSACPLPKRALSIQAGMKMSTYQEFASQKPSMLLRTMTMSSLSEQKRPTAPLFPLDAHDADAPIEEPNSTSDDNDGQEARSSKTTTDGERIPVQPDNNENGHFLDVETEDSEVWARSADQCSNTEEYFGQFGITLDARQ